MSTGWDSSTAATLDGVISGTSKILINSSGVGVTNLTNTNGIVYAGASGLLSNTTVGTSGQVLTSNGTGVAPTFQATAGVGTSTPTANTNAQWDSFVNMSAFGFIPGYVSTATSAGTTTLTSASVQDHFFTGTNTHTVLLPSVTSIVVTGQYWKIVNNSTQAISVQTSTSAVVLSLAGGSSGMFTVISLSNNNATSWNGEVTPVLAGIGTSGQVWTSNGSGNTPTFQTPSISGTVTVPQGGTGITTTTAYGVLAGGTTATGNFQNVGTGTSGYVLTSNGASALPTYQVLAGVSGTAPTVQRFLSSSGNYTTPAGVSYISVRAVGGGGGGAGSSTYAGANGGSGGTGGNTTFGSVITCNGGTGATGGAGNAGTGGTATLNAPGIGTALQGAYGDSSSQANVASVAYMGGSGGTSPFGGAGGGGLGNVAVGTAGITNTGSGGGGAGSPNQGISGGGGGGGGYIDALLTPTAGQVYAYVVGAAGTAGAAGTSGAAGGAGGSGIIIVTEFYPNTGVNIASTLIAVPPTVQKFTSGTSATYTTPAGVSYIEVEMVGGGGGGSGGGTSSVTTAGNGGTTSFGTSMFSCGGGQGGQSSGAGGTGGTSTLGTGPVGTAFVGGVGGKYVIITSATGSFGGTSPFGGAGAANAAAVANTGSGGGGGGGVYGGPGGGAGGWAHGIITSPTSTYTYSVGAGGTAGTAAAGGEDGGAGGSGVIIVTEYYPNAGISASPLAISGGGTGLSSALRHQVKVYTSNGYGSTNTKIVRWTTTSTTGSNITLTQSSTLGDIFTINTTGLYSVALSWGFATTGWCGISLNSSQLTTNIESITAADVVAIAYAGVSGGIVAANACLILTAGDIIRVHNDGGAGPPGSARSYFTITQVGI